MTDNPIKVIVGLGNPGRKYDGTRHNIGFDVLNLLHRQLGDSTPRSKFDGQFVRYEIADQSVILVWPLTFMNESGRCVRQMVDFFKVAATENILVVCDDLSLPTGKIRLRPKGSAGGQKGLAHILRVLGSQEIPRLRIGIGATPPGWDTAGYVLGKFSKEEKPEVDIAVETAAKAVQDWITYDLTHCMNTYN